MNSREYGGKILHFIYPGFLKVKTEEPQWSAYGPKGTSAALVVVDPLPTTAAAFARMIRNPRFAQTPGAFIEREGAFKTANGIEGHERVTRMNNTMGWFIDGKFNNDRILNIQLWTNKDDWNEGTIWGQFIHSIRVVGDPLILDSPLLPSKPGASRNKAAKEPRQKMTGVLSNFPDNLHYMLDMASKLRALSPEHLEENPKAFQLLDNILRKVTNNLTQEETRQRMQSDYEQLWSWLQRHPVEKYPETAFLYTVAGLLVNAKGLFE